MGLVLQLQFGAVSGLFIACRTVKIARGIYRFVGSVSFA
jgi:hypothetical protein